MFGCLLSANVFRASERRADAVKRLSSDSSNSPTGPLSTLSRISSNGRNDPSGTGAADKRGRGEEPSRTASGIIEALEGRLKGNGAAKAAGVSGTAAAVGVLGDGGESGFDETELLRPLLSLNRLAYHSR